MDYKSTLNLPRTDFQMKADLPKREPELIRQWQAKRLYEKILSTGRGKKDYILHDGPPYANGNIHMGHALNKILKDIVVKSRFMMGYRTDYVPGWDCHGLPIELQVEKSLGKDKEGLSKLEIRRRCREYAERFVKVQREEFIRLGVFGRWDEPYLTMDYSYQATILRELGRFLKEGLIYRGKKPVHWCADCRTALAEAEVEYYEKQSPSVYVSFRVKDDKGLKLPENTCMVIWTTTPWTLPANLAIAVHPELTYSLVRTDRGNFLLYEGLVEECMRAFHIEEYTVEEGFRGQKLKGIVTEHPFLQRNSVVFTAGFVTTSTGTGCVHIAPGHGTEDYELGLREGLDVYAPVDERGRFTAEVPEFCGMGVFEANPAIVRLLKERGALLSESTISHSYPHCWRCKNPVIFRATEQWFVAMDKGLRERALEAIEGVEWIPHWGKERIRGMVSQRPDWCLSRQRVWGVPIPALKCAGCGEVFLDGRLIEHLADIVEREGADVWFERNPEELIPQGFRCPVCSHSKGFEKKEDILDVWFDSGVSFSAVLEKRKGLRMPADLYLEGSDQHRGWFQSSLLASVGTRNMAPYRTVLTHGFVVDGEGRKMSKSLGNVISPQEVIKRYGAEVLRLWVSAEDYREDIRISEEILKRLSEAYRRIRNTIRFILGNLYDFEPDKHSVEYRELKELDRLLLHRLTGLTRRVLKAYEEFEFHVIFHSMHNFCAVDLSAFYLDILKDRLYTTRADSHSRRAAQTTLCHILDHLLRLLAPVLVFTTDEAWQFLPQRPAESVHLTEFPQPREEWIDTELEKKWNLILSVKDEISRALEMARKDKLIGHSLDARVYVSLPDALKPALSGQEETLREVLIVSQLEFRELTEGVEGKELEGIKIAVERAEGRKCERCWHISPTVGENSEHPSICRECVEVLS